MNSMKILLVDDDAFLRDMYATKFEQEGDAISVAESGTVALQNLSEASFDVVLMDMVMPGMTGLDLIEEIHKLDGHKDTKCIILSNQSEPADKEAAAKLGAVGYIVKAEMLPSEVVEEVHSIVGKK